MALKKIKKITAAVTILTLLTVPARAYAREMPEKLVPMGSAIGISIKMNGVLVAGTGDEQCPAAEAGIKPGDVIVAVDGKKVAAADDLRGAFAHDRSVEITVVRDGKKMPLTVMPEGGSIGVYVRDEINGIGTMTFYDPETGVFGALGHAVCENGSVEFTEGVISPAEIGEVVIGKAGTPGQLGGTFDVENSMGVILAGGKCGVFGVLDREKEGAALPTGHTAELKTGPAEILSTVDGEKTEKYDVEIVRVYSGSDDNRCFMLRVTDDRLLDTTGGIVQGMSGSPVIQNGKLVGAVTHVLISDPTRGYGIAIDKMLAAAGYENENAA